MNYIGDFSEDSTIRIALTTNNTSGAAVAPSSAFEAADFVIYKNGSATQKATTNGITCTSPFDSVVGLHILEIDTSNDTGDSGFWTTGADYWVVAIPDETVDSQTVVQVVAAFSIENRLRVKPTDTIALSTAGNGAVADAVWDELYAGHTTAGSFGKIMDLLRKANFTIDGTVSSAITPTTLTFSSNVSATTSAYAHAVLLFVSGPLTGENSPIISYDNTNGVFVLEEPLTAAPSDGDEFVVIAGSHVHSVAAIQSGLATSSGVTAAFTEIKGAGWSATDTLEEIRDAVDAGGGGSTVIVSPLQAVGPERVAGTEIVAYINDTGAIGPIAVTDADGVAVDLSGLTLKVCVEKIDGTILGNVSPTISGTDNNQFTFTPTAESVAKTGTFRWSLRKTSNNQVYALGDFVVDPAARIST